MVRCRFVRLSLARTVNHSLFGSKNDRAGLRQASAYGREQQILYYYSPTESRRIGSVAAPASCAVPPNVPLSGARGSDGNACTDTCWRDASSRIKFETEECSSENSGKRTSDLDSENARSSPQHLKNLKNRRPSARGVSASPAPARVLGETPVPPDRGGTAARRGRPAFDQLQNATANVVKYRAQDLRAGAHEIAASELRGKNNRSYYCLLPRSEPNARCGFKSRKLLLFLFAWSS